MRTFDEIIKYVDESYPEVSVHGRAKICMQIAASQALDLAAEKTQMERRSDIKSFLRLRTSILGLKQQMK